jgi:hypothetical protein
MKFIDRAIDVLGAFTCAAGTGVFGTAAVLTLTEAFQHTSHPTLPDQLLGCTMALMCAGLATALGHITAEMTREAFRPPAVMSR